MSCFLGILKAVCSTVSVDVWRAEIGKGPQAHATLEGGGGSCSVSFVQGFVAEVMVEGCSKYHSLVESKPQCAFFLASETGDGDVEVG